MEKNRQPGRPRSTVLLRLGIAVGALLLLVVAAIVTVSVLNQSRTAQATAQQYFAALAAGDATTANALTAPNDLDAHRDDLLTDEMLSGASERISEVSVVPANDPLDVFEQKVEVSYTLAGERHTQTVLVARGEPDWGVLRTWKMNGPFASDLSFSVEGPGDITIAGAEIDATARSVRLFPAVYPLAAVESEHFELAEDELVVDGTDGLASLQFLPTAALVEEAQAQVNEMVDVCVETTPTSEQLDGCPLFVVLAESGHAPGTWEVVDYPTVELPHGGVIYTTSDGLARFTPADGRDPVDMLRGIELTGTVEVSGGEVSLAPWGQRPL